MKNKITIYIALIITIVGCGLLQSCDPPKCLRANIHNIDCDSFGNENVKFRIEYNVDYKVWASEEWVQLTDPKLGTRLSYVFPEREYSVTIKAYTIPEAIANEFKSRQAKINITSKSGLSDYIAINQLAPSFIEELSYDDLIFESNDDKVTEVNMHVNSYEVDSDAEWLEIVEKDSSFSVSVKEYTEDEAVINNYKSRNSEIIITIKNKQEFIYIEQKAPEKTEP